MLGEWLLRFAYLMPELLGNDLDDDAPEHLVWVGTVLSCCFREGRPLVLADRAEHLCDLGCKFLRRWDPVVRWHACSEWYFGSARTHSGTLWLALSRVERRRLS